MQIEFAAAIAAVIADNSGKDDVCEGVAPERFRCSWLNEDCILVELVDATGFYTWDVRAYELRDAHRVVRGVRYCPGVRRRVRCV